jgi:hypothetical protein
MELWRSGNFETFGARSPEAEDTKAKLDLVF